MDLLLCPGCRQQFTAKGTAPGDRWSCLMCDSELKLVASDVSESNQWRMKPGGLAPVLPPPTEAKSAE